MPYYGQSFRTDESDLVSVKGRTLSIMGFTVARVRIVEIDAMADPERVRRIAGAFGGKRD